MTDEQCLKIQELLQINNQNIVDSIIHRNDPITFENQAALDKYVREQVEAEIARREESSAIADGKGW